MLGDERYLDAAKRAADAYGLYSLECNTNYMAFVLWHLSELFQLTGEAKHLERALWYTKHAILRGMTPSGAQPGHNYYSAYGNITLKGLAKLLRVLPAAHDFRSRRSVTCQAAGAAPAFRRQRCVSDGCGPRGGPKDSPQRGTKSLADARNGGDLRP